MRIGSCGWSSNVSVRPSSTSRLLLRRLRFSRFLVLTSAKCCTSNLAGSQCRMNGLMLITGTGNGTRTHMFKLWCHLESVLQGSWQDDKAASNVNVVVVHSIRQHWHVVEDANVHPVSIQWQRQIRSKRRELYEYNLPFRAKPVLTISGQSEWVFIWNRSYPPTTTELFSSSSNGKVKFILSSLAIERNFIQWWRRKDKGRASE